MDGHGFIIRDPAEARRRPDAGHGLKPTLVTPDAMRVPRRVVWIACAWAAYLVLVAGLARVAPAVAALVSPAALLLVVATGYALPWRASAALLASASLAATLAGPDSVGIHLDLGGGNLPAGPSLLLVGLVLLGLGAAAQLGLDAARRAGREEGARRAAEQEAVRLRLVLRSAGHEIANVLMPMYFMADHVRDALGDREAAAKLDRSANRIRRLMGDLNDAARSMEGGLTLRKTPCDLSAIVRGLADDFQENAQGNHLSLSVEGPAAVPAVADVERVEQVVANLLQNAVRYTPEGGRVRVRVERAQGQAVIEVQDTGVGLTVEQIHGLFQPFVRYHKETVAGSGLGLWVARNIAEAHGGSIQAASPGPGRGSVFTVRLPETPA